MTPYRISLTCVVLALVCVHLSWWISVYFGNLNLCLPYWSDCHSISATGRQYPEFFVFKALMIPTAVFMWIYWCLVYEWVKQISQQKIKPKFILCLGLIAASALIVYVVTLGAVGEPYALARRIGVIHYFGFTCLAHLLLLIKLNSLELQNKLLLAWKNQLVWVCIILFSTSILSALAGFYWEHWDAWENAYEWWFSLLMIYMFFIVGRMWKTSNFTIKLALNKV